MRGIVAIVGLGIGLAAIGYAVFLFTAKPAEPPTVEHSAIIVEGMDMGETPIYTEVPARIRIRNNSNAAIRFVGGPSGCQPGGCMRTAGPCPLTIAANSVEEIPLAVSVSKGPFRLEVPVYLDKAGATVERTVYLTGIGVPPADHQPTHSHP